MSQILFYNRYDGLGVLYYPYEPFDLAISQSDGETIISPIIKSERGNAYFVSRKEKITLSSLELNPNEDVPDWVLNWVDSIRQGGVINIDINMLSSEHKLALKAMLQRKQIALQKWLLNK